jgi:hypothetical protein
MVEGRGIIFTPCRNFLITLVDHLQQVMRHINITTGGGPNFLNMGSNWKKNKIYGAKLKKKKRKKRKKRK